MFLAVVRRAGVATRMAITAADAGAGYCDRAVGLPKRQPNHIGIWLQKG
jgi:hypothetical protein